MKPLFLIVGMVFCICLSNKVEAQFADSSVTLTPKQNYSNSPTYQNQNHSIDNNNPTMDKSILNNQNVNGNYTVPNFQNPNTQNPLFHNRIDSSRNFKNNDTKKFN